jgi:hypothetical protein
MTDLIKRLEKAEAGSRELDFAIMAHFGYTDISDPRDAVECWRGPDGKSHFANATFSRSLDAALALAERVLPGLYMWNVEFDDEPTSTPASAKVYAKRDGQGYAATAALALCIAILNATDTGRE